MASRDRQRLQMYLGQKVGHKVVEVLALNSWGVSPGRIKDLFQKYEGSLTAFKLGWQA